MMRWFMWISMTALLALTLFSTPFPDWLHKKVHQERVQEFARVYADLRLASFHYGNNSDQARIAREEILQKRGFDNQKFSSEFNRLKEDPLLWTVFEKEVVVHLESIEQALMPKGNQK